MMDLEKDGLPPYSYSALPEVKIGGTKQAPQLKNKRRSMRRSRAVRFVTLACLLFIAFAQWKQSRGLPGPHHPRKNHGLSIDRLQENLATCAKLRHKPKNPTGLGRERNARYVDGQKPTLIRNATVWVGEAVGATSEEDARAGHGFAWIKADVFIQRGLIQTVEADISLASLPEDTLIWDAKGRQLTSGIIDMHSHSGVDSLPNLVGNDDTNEMSSDITPYVRSIDAIQPLDPQFQVIKSGGVTTSLVLPGSGNNIGGEAYVVKHAIGQADGRSELSAEDMLADPDRNWRYMKMACGENAKRVYGKAGERGPYSRMGESWAFRQAFEHAQKLVREQDDWCAEADAVGIEHMSHYLPEDLEWESLGAVLRGQVHINTHCYTIPDLEAFVDHTNEFKFPVRAFHHAHSTYLVPEILKRAYGDQTPASAIFADNMYYKAEAYVGSEYAGKILFDNGFDTIYVSDNPVINAQHVLFEAARGYKYGLPYHAALASVTSLPAHYLGLGERIGKIKPGFDADIAVWDSDPLSVGAAPVQVWIDGTAQFKDPVELNKSVSSPIVPDPSLGVIPGEPVRVKDIVYTGITRSLLPGMEAPATTEEGSLTLVVLDGKIQCFGSCEAELRQASDAKVEVISLANGYVTKGFTAFGSLLGLNEIDMEADTDNGPSRGKAFSRGVDGLALDTKKLGVAHRYGVTKAITAPKYRYGISRHGTSVGFRTGAANSLEDGAVWGEDVAVHYTLSLAAKGDTTPSISSAVGALRSALLEAVTSEEEKKITDRFSEKAFLRKVVRGETALVVSVHSADTIAALLRVKKEVEAAAATKLRVAILGGAESHLVAEQLADAEVGVVLAPLLSYGTSWEERRALTGAPLTNGTAVDALVAAGVVVGIGLYEDWVIRDLALHAGIALRNGGGKVTDEEALEMISGNLYKILGVEEPEGEFLVFEGNPLEITGRVRGVGGSRFVDVV
ncbi:uncharacterized protein DNG_05606 [Cephalotrichum gorgonifer]|uniref:Amidohydrolase-related domain-containing protein n=1 Tax=Cephalotrichum gorgonifer TaxID=2041049 RepID=A0AAE8N059_9PEZI|nr:uncharacterized protein DNG_05606 [Cephalotrichum gorgonifer]